MNSLTELSQYIESKPEKQCVIWAIVEIMSALEVVKQQYGITSTDIYKEEYDRK